jgi:NAD(P)-dependent dehydrogenase (short-subunit alcohol dehydrogenase family)
VFILNAGINAVDNDETFDLTVFRDVLETNLLGIVNFVGPLTSLARRPGPCHVIAISSMASFAGNPYGLGYHVSKRALTSCFATWARMYDGTDLVFQQVMLGPVRTPMYDMAKRLPRWMAWGKRALTVSPESTARAIARLARTRTTKLYFPKRAALPFFGMWFAQSVLEILFLGRKTLAGASRRSAVSAHDRRGEGSP